MSRAELSGLRRTLVRLQRLLAPEPAALFRLLSRPPAWMAEADVQNLRESAEEFATAVADSGALAAIVNEQSNRILFLLTVVTVLALPFNVIGGLFGMNVGGIPFAAHRHGFLIVITVAVALTVLGGVMVMRRRRDW